MVSTRSDNIVLPSDYRPSMQACRQGALLLHWWSWLECAVKENFLLPSWKQQVRPKPYTLQLSCWRQQMCTIHTGDTPWLPDMGGQGSWHNWAPLDCNNLKDSFCKPPIPAHCTNSLKHNPSIPVKKAYLFSLEFQYKKQASDLLHT